MSSRSTTFASRRHRRVPSVPIVLPTALLATLMLVGCGGSAHRGDPSVSRLEIRTLSARADWVTDGDALVELLNAKGFDIARRTVAKYREAMGIGSSVQRRRARALEGA